MAAQKGCWLRTYVHRVHGLGVPHDFTGDISVSAVSSSVLHGTWTELCALQDPMNVMVYSGHVQPTTVTRISLSGYYVASADMQGNNEFFPTDPIPTSSLISMRSEGVGRHG